MFEEPDEAPQERSLDPADQAREKFTEFRMHAELAAVFEGPRKFDARLLPISGDGAREIQRTIGRLEKAKSPESPILPPDALADAARLLRFPVNHELSTNDYHIHARPGEVMIVRWLEGDQVDAFYERFQAHFEAALEGFRDEQRQAQAWKQDEKTLKFLAALDAIDVKMADVYLRPIIRKHNVYVLSTQAADELNLQYLCDYILGCSPEELVGVASAPPEEPTESDLAWFFKLFSLRGMDQGSERMCFFAFMQKTSEGW